jgi:MFS family permease
MLLGMLGAAVCYAVAALSPIGYVGVAASVLTGFAVSMLWPGTIILVGEKFPAAGVAAYALMAAGGDFGASVAPQLLGIIADRFGTSSLGVLLSEKLSITAEVVGMRAGMLIGALFPLIGFFILLYMKRYFSRRKIEDCTEEKTKNISTSID